MLDYQKERVFHHFREISRIPRESGNEKGVSDYLVGWAKVQGLEVLQDEFLNVVIIKPASAGYAHTAPILLQAHMDMVCEKTPDSTHDFTQDPIQLQTDGDWLLSACGTSLGADNGIGIACALAILEDNTLTHPLIEAVFTVEEETTFKGAGSISARLFKGRRMINLDHADDRELVAGSCGGTGAHITLPLMWETETPKDYEAYCVTVSGLRGGHSGEDIHRGRGNAISLLLRILDGADVRIVSVDGGTNRLAIPREASAIVLAKDAVSFAKHLSAAKDIFRKEYGAAAPELDVQMERAASGEPMNPMTDSSFKKVIAAATLLPNGIVNMNGVLEGVVESSNNVGIIKTFPNAGEMKITCEVRGLYGTTVADIKRKILLLADMLGAQVEFFGGYVSWEYVDESSLRQDALDVYNTLFGEDMKVLAIHAGLECGMFAEKIPGMDIISIGPTCQYFHSPNERVSISSVRKFYRFLTVLLETLAMK